MRAGSVMGAFLAGTLLCSSAVLAANWKTYYKNAEIKPGINCNVAYDSDSIYFPKERDGFFGKTKDKSFIGLWTKVECTDGTVTKYHMHVDCSQRQITLKEIMADDQYIYPPQLGRSYYIEPGSTDELLARAFCK